MDELLGKKPNVDPLITISNGAGIKKREEKTEIKEEKKTSPAQRRAAQRQAMYDDREANRERRHQEKLALLRDMTSKVDTFANTTSEALTYLKKIAQQD
jgi:hypothetical protein